MIRSHPMIPKSDLCRLFNMRIAPHLPQFVQKHNEILSQKITFIIVIPDVQDIDVNISLCNDSKDVQKTLNLIGSKKLLDRRMKKNLVLNGIVRMFLFVIPKNPFLFKTLSLLLIDYDKLSKITYFGNFASKYIKLNAKFQFSRNLVKKCKKQFCNPTGNNFLVLEIILTDTCIMHHFNINELTTWYEEHLIPKFALEKVISSNSHIVMVLGNYQGYNQFIF